MADGGWRIVSSGLEKMARALALPVGRKWPDGGPEAFCGGNYLRRLPNPTRPKSTPDKSQPTTIKNKSPLSHISSIKSQTEEYR